MKLSKEQRIGVDDMLDRADAHGNDVATKVDSTGKYIRTPWDLCEEIVERIVTYLGFQGKTILVVDTVEFIPVLLAFGAEECNITYVSPYKYKGKEIAKDIFEVRTETQNFIEWNSNMKFDIIIGNPPYQATDSMGNRKSKSTNLWSKFTQKSFELLSPGGVVGLITPAAWASSTVDINEGKIKIFSDIFKNNNPLIFNLTTVGKYFPTVGSTFSYFIVENCKNQGRTDIILQNGSSIVVDISDFPSLPKNITKESLSINKKFFSLCTNNETCQGQLQSKSCRYSPITDLEFMYPAYHTASVYKKGECWYTDTQHPNKEKRKIIFSLSGYFQPFKDSGDMGYTDMCLAYILKDSDNIEYAYDVFNSKLYKFYLNENKWSGFNPKEIIRSFPVLDFSRPWTDKELYDHFGLTEEERLHIDPSYKA